MGAPVEQVAKMSAADFFVGFAELMKANPPHANDYPILQQMERLGIVPGKSFDLSKAPPETKAALEAAPAAGFAKITAYAPHAAALANDWAIIITRFGTYGRITSSALSSPTSVSARMWSRTPFIPARWSIPRQAVVQERNKYVLHFEKDEIPPVRAFW